MKPRRTHESNTVFRLEGGTEDNDLWARRCAAEGSEAPIISSVWVPTDEERAAIAAGSNLDLIVWGVQQPPISLQLTDVPLGAAPRDPETDGA